MENLNTKSNLEPRRNKVYDDIKAVKMEHILEYIFNILSSICTLQNKVLDVIECRNISNL